MRLKEDAGKRKHPLRRIAATAAGAVLLALVMAHMSGVLTPDRVGPQTPVPQFSPAPPPERTGEALLQTITETERAVGTVRPRTETRIEAQVTPRILEVKVRAGDEVEQGDLLIVLDGGQMQARLEQAAQSVKSAQARKRQAEHAVSSAEAVLAEAGASYERTRKYFEDEAATLQDMERAGSVFAQAEASVEQARQALQESEAGVRRAVNVVEEARISLGYTRIQAPEPGRVAERTAETGDLAWPGKTLLTLHTRGALRLESLVREGLIGRIRTAGEKEVFLDTLSKTVRGVVEEVVPSADPVTRTFLVKVSLPATQGLYPGMFGRLLVPVEERGVVTVHRDALIRVGQLEMVSVLAGDRWERVFIKTGRAMGDRIEVLSGLGGGETVGFAGGAP
jgi:HlyD family secretion protein